MTGQLEVCHLFNSTLLYKSIILIAANTHVHADHITGTGRIKERLPSCKSVISEYSKADADVKIKEGDKIKFGKFQLEVRSTPGHTDGKESCVFKQPVYIEFIVVHGLSQFHACHNTTRFCLETYPVIH